MKKYFIILASALAALAFSSCEKDEYGTVAGNDKDPYVVVSVNNAVLPNDPDCDAFVRLTANNATTEVYYLAESAASKAARNMSDEAYADYVVANGQKASVSSNAWDGSQGVDVIMKSLYGDNVISAVAVGNGKKQLYSASYYGYKWNTVATGTYQFGSGAIYNTLGARTKSGIMLQQSDDNPTQFRFKDLYMEGKHLRFNLLADEQREDEDGVYTILTVPSQATGLNHATYGAMNVRDAYARYGDITYITEAGYEGGMYSDYTCFLFLSVQVAAGNFGFGYDFFFPN